MELIDIGANLTHESFQHDFDAVLERAGAAGIVQAVVTGTSVQGSEAAARLARAHPRRLFATAGIHPHSAADWDAQTSANLEGLAGQPEVVALGEMGLDYFRDFSPRDAQREAFEAQLTLAVKTQLPVFLHERDAHPDFVSILREYRDELSDAVIHCFTGSGEALSDYLDLGLYVGVTGWICDDRRGLHLRELVSKIPADRLMIETDSPYLLPRDIRPKPKSRRNEPHHLAHIAQVVASLRGEDVLTLARSTTDNARRFFRL
ncbi:MAG: YchF/TatD family DNA exonuclease [Gammaproteobacteria bacterium]|nr:YchF/TatD family DNA exonuclease [Gammaproteobacteria bacterium]